MTDLQKRAQNIRIRLATLKITHGIKARDVAIEAGYTPEYMSAVLGGKYESEELCQKLEELLKKLESDDEQLKIAA